MQQEVLDTMGIKPVYVEKDITIRDCEYKALIEGTYWPDGEEYKVTRVQLEVAENIWSDLNSDHFHLIEQMLSDPEFWK